MRYRLIAALVGCGSQVRGGELPGRDAGTTTTPPTVLATFDPTVLNGSKLALDSAFLYFTTTAGVMRVSIAGGTPSELAAGMRGPLVVDADNVYGFNATGIVSVPKSGGVPISVKSGSQLGQYLAVDDAHLYFHDYYGLRANGDNYHQSIFQLTLATGTVVNIATNQFVTGPFASDAANLYWFSDNGPSGAVNLMSVVKSGGAVTTLATGLGAPDGPASDGTNLYWTTFGGWTSPPPPSTLGALASSGGTVSVLASALDQPGDLAVDSSSVYFTVRTDSIMRMPKTGGTPMLLATQLASPASLVLDDANVYFIEAGSGTIDRVAK